jgi:hypothetical protein
MSDNNKPKPAKSLSDFWAQFKKNYPDSYKEKYPYTPKKRLSGADSLIPENIKEKILENKMNDQFITKDDKWRAEQNEIIRRENAAEKAAKEAAEKAEKEAAEKAAKKVGKEVIYDNKGNLLDITGKIVKKAGDVKKPPFGSGKLGMLLGLGAAALGTVIPKDSMAGTAMRILDEGDPASLFFPEGAGEGEDEEVMKMKEEQRQKYLDNLVKNVPKNKKLRSEEQDNIKKQVEPIVKILGGDPDLKEKDALKMIGETPSGDENLLSVEDSERKLKKKFGYE